MKNIIFYFFWNDHAYSTPNTRAIDYISRVIFYFSNFATYSSIAKSVSS